MRNPATPTNDDKEFDEFLDDASHAVADLWKSRGGAELTDDEKCDVNDLLTEYFRDKRTCVVENNATY